MNAFDMPFSKTYGSRVSREACVREEGVAGIPFGGEAVDQIRLEKVNYNNIRRILELRVAEEQASFVAANSESMIEAYLTLAEGRPVFPFGIFRGEEAVGFLMIGYDYHDEDEHLERPGFVDGSYLLWRLMIDRAHQQKGYGRKAVRLVLDFMRTFPCGKAEYCWLSYEPENRAARELYRSFGFKELQERPKGWDEIPAVLKL